MTSQNRRQFLRLLGVGAAGAGAVAAGVQLRPGGTTDATGEPGAMLSARQPTGDHAPLPAERTVTPPASGARTLVVIELDGGNDGLSTLIPAADPAYRRMRRRTGLQPDEVVEFADGLGLHPGLAPLQRHGLAVLAGVGTENPDLSHFEMARRWAVGDSPGNAGRHNGFLGSCCDALRGDEIISGISLGYSASPAMQSDAAVTMSVPDLYGMEPMTRQDLWASEFRDGLRLMSAASEESMGAVDITRRGIGDALEFGGVLRTMPDESDRYPDDDFAQRLQTVSRMLRSGAGVRIVHVPLGGFDTHEEHRWQHDELMRRLGTGLDAFLTDMAESGLSDDVLVATTSEFGRRPQENESGTDHGAASVALLAGPVHPGVHGDPSPLDDLDADDNLRVTVDMARYYATLAEGWLDLDAAGLINGDTTPIGGLLRV